MTGTLQAISMLALLIFTGMVATAAPNEPRHYLTLQPDVQMLDVSQSIISKSIVQTANKLAALTAIRQEPQFAADLSGRQLLRPTPARRWRLLRHRARFS